MLKLPTLLCLLFFIPSAAQAGAWTQERGALQTINSKTFYNANSFYDSHGNKKSQAPYDKAELSLYAEYGLFKDITIGGQISAAIASIGINGARYLGYNLGDTEIFARKNIWQDAHAVFSLQPSIILPSPDAKNAVPKIGSDYLSAGLRAAYGQNFKALGKWHYADLSAAYIARTASPADQLKFDLTFGLNLSKKIQLIPQAFITKSTKHIKQSSLTQSSADNYDVVKLQLSVQYQWDEKRALQFGAFSAVSGKNTGAGRGIMVSFVRNF